MDFDELKEKHRKMWTFITDRIKSGELRMDFTVNSLKSEFLNSVEDYPRYMCYLCDYYDMCRGCPLKAGGKSCSDAGNPYFELNDEFAKMNIGRSFDISKMIECAEKIRDIMEEG